MNSLILILVSIMLVFLNVLLFFILDDMVFKNRFAIKIRKFLGIE